VLELQQRCGRGCRLRVVPPWWFSGRVMVQSRQWREKEAMELYRWCCCGGRGGGATKVACCSGVAWLPQVMRAVLQWRT